MSKILTCIGLMSGTSLDGIDVALLRTDGDGQVERGLGETITYDTEQQSKLRRALRDAALMVQRDERPGCLAEVEAELTAWHADAVNSFCARHGISHSNIDIIGFHGQTVLHRPEARLTVQLGDGAALARVTGIAVAHDLRAPDVAAGGQGAPLVPVYHRALAAKLAARPVAFINIGGVANLTWIGAGDALVAFDTGPGNALLNDWCLSHGAGPLDRDGALAAQGVADEAAITTALRNAFFGKAPPKSLDRNSFAVSDFAHLGPADGARTLTAFTASSIAAGLRIAPQPAALVVLCGGGRRNPVMVAEIRQRCACPVALAEDFGFNGDSMEAEAWAYLAARSSLKLDYSFPGTTGVAQPMTGGVISLP